MPIKAVCECHITAMSRRTCSREKHVPVGAVQRKVAKIKVSVKKKIHEG